MTSPASHPRDPLHGVTLEQILSQLVPRHGWGEMGRRIPVRRFQFNPTVKSSSPWKARYSAMESKAMILRHGFVRCRG